MRLFLDLAQQRSAYLGVYTESPDYQEILTTVERVLNKKPFSTHMKQKYTPKAKEELVVPKAEELPIAIEDGKILCNFEFACYLSMFAQKVLEKAPVPKRKLKIDRKRRIDHFGGLVIDRTINLKFLPSSFDPYKPLTATSVQSGSTCENLTSRKLGKGSLSIIM